MANNEETDEVEAADTTAQLACISPQYIVRFMTPARIAYSHSLYERQREKGVDFHEMMGELREEGRRYLGNAQQDDCEDARFVPYRRFLKAMFKYALGEKAAQDKKDSKPIVTLPHNGKYTSDHWKLLDRCYEVKKLNDQLLRIFQHSYYLMSQDMNYYFDIISSEIEPSIR